MRRGTAEAVTEALEPGLRTRAYVFNTLLQDKAIGDRLRELPDWLATRNLSNEASDESVQALVEAVKGRYELARRWYRDEGASCSASSKLADYDRMASVSADDEEIEWEEGREIVRDTFASFSGGCRRGRRPLLRRALDRRPAPRGQARRRLSAPRPSPRSTPT